MKKKPPGLLVVEFLQDLREKVLAEVGPEELEKLQNNPAVCKVLAGDWSMPLGTLLSALAELGLHIKVEKEEK